MKLFDKIEMSINDLKRRKFRTFLTAFSVAVGTMLVIDMFGIGQGMQNIINKQLDANGGYKLVQVKDQAAVKQNGKYNYKMLTEDTLKQVKNLKNSKDLYAELKAEASKIEIDGKTDKNTEITGIDTNYSYILPAEKKANKKNPLLAGRLLNKGEEGSIVVGQSALSLMGIEDYKSVLGKTAHITAELPAIKGVNTKAPLKFDLKIVGVIDKKYNQRSKFAISIAESSKILEYFSGEANYFKVHGYSKVLAEAKTFAGVKKLSDEINGIGYGASSYQKQTESIRQVMAVFKMILTIGGIIVLLVACLGLINTMTMAVQEKTKSIGIMKAVGASRKDIRGIFVVQSGTIGFLGGLLGSILAIVTSKLVDSMAISGIRSLGMNLGHLDSIVTIDIATILATIAFAVVMSIIAGSRPSRKAAKLDAVETLSYE